MDYYPMFKQIDDCYFTAKEAAKYLGYSVKTFYVLVRDYQIPRYGPSRNRYKKTDLDRFMESPSCFYVERTTAHSRPPIKIKEWLKAQETKP